MPIASINPATGETLKSLEALSDAEIEDRLQQAAETFRKYRQTTFAERAGKMMRAAEILEEDKKQFGQTMTTEMGKPIKAAIAEAEKCAWVCRFYAENAERFLADEMVQTNATRSFIRHQAIGPVLAVMPWNFSFVASLSLRRARVDGRQRRAPQARLKRAGVRARNRRHLSQC